MENKLPKGFIVEKELDNSEWVEDGQVWMDISQVLKDKNTALKLAKKANQEAVFDLSNFETIYLEPPS
jgi:hypothetical protein